MRKWNRDELLVAFGLYCQLPFGKLHRGNPAIIALAKLINRTPSALAMKLGNFASFDPLLRKRGIGGLKNAGRIEKEIWSEFQSNPEKIAYESKLAESLLLRDNSSGPNEMLAKDSSKTMEERPTEKEQSTKVRLVQSFFRKTVLSSYQYQCAICALKLPELLIASHIIPWSVDEKRRADPNNGLSLCALHDKAFDRGIIAIDSKMKVLVSDRIEQDSSCSLLQVGLLQIRGTALTLPQRFAPCQKALNYHRHNIFIN